MIPTPDLSHMKKEDYANVYEPAEDTFLLLDALERDATELQAMKPTVCLEIGSGSGCVSAFISKILGPKQALYLCTDINAYAAECTLRTGNQNSVEIQPMLAFLAEPVLKRLHHHVDLLLFNPPYVPTGDDELEEAQTDKGLAGAWAGGTNGMQLTNKLLDCVEHLLTPEGRFYLVALKTNGIENIRIRMLREFHLESEICLKRRAGREHLFVLRFHKQS